ncbi:hypothetical protein ACJZ2D_009981 [Fusarium nematophilum]
MESAILSSVARALSPRTRAERARRKGYRRRRTAIKKLHELESICGYEVWTLMKKDNKVYIYHSANRSPEPPLRTDILETYPLPVIYTSGNADGDEPGIRSPVGKEGSPDSG